MKELEIIIFGFVSVIGSLLLLVLAFNCLQAIYDNLRSRSIVKKITGKLRRILGNWHPGNRSTRSVVVRLQSLSFLRFKGRATNEQEKFGRAAFQFEIIGTSWIAIVLDNTFGRQAQTIFIDSSTSSEQRRYVWYGSFLQQIPRELRRQFEQHRELFHKIAADREDILMSGASPFRAKLKHWLGRIVGWLFGAYATVAGLYLVYGLIYEKGIVGHLVYYFGEDQGGGDSVTGGGGVAIVLYLFSLLSYFFLEDFVDDDQRNNTEPRTIQEPLANGPPTAELVRPISWKTILLTNVTIVILTVLACLPFVVEKLSDQQQPVVLADLTQGELPAEEAKFAAIHGILRSDYELDLIKNVTTHRVWTPLVGSDWRPELPIKYVYYRRWESAGTSSNPLPVWHGPQDPTMRSKWLKRQGRLDTAPVPTYTVQLSKNSLPTWIEMMLRDKGVTLASPYYLAEQVQLDSEGKVDADPTNIIAGLVIASLVGFVITFFLIMDRVVHRSNVRESLPVSVTAAQIISEAVIHLPMPNGTALHFKFPRNAKSGDIFRLSKSESDPEGESILRSLGRDQLSNS